MKGSIFLFFVLMFAFETFSNTAKVGVLAIDEVTGAPVSNVAIDGMFSNLKGWTRKNEPDVDSRRTDKMGRCDIKGTTNQGVADCVVRAVPPGYYTPPVGEYREFARKDFFGVWQPDNLVITLKLQRVENPIPLFVKQVGLWEPIADARDVFPAGKDSVSFDFVKGDWLPPAGNGEVADVVFTRLPKQSFGVGKNFSGVEGEMYRDSLVVRFPGKENGICDMGSRPNLGLQVRTAPEDCYLPEIVCWRGVGKELADESNYSKHRNWCFRIRARRDENGKIVDALYGKIYGDVSFVCQLRPVVVRIAKPCFRYYLNPKPMDRNLEWNMTNLNKGAGVMNWLSP